MATTGILKDWVSSGRLNSESAEVLIVNGIDSYQALVDLQVEDAQQLLSDPHQTEILLDLLAEHSVSTKESQKSPDCSESLESIELSTDLIAGLTKRTLLTMQQNGVSTVKDLTEKWTIITASMPVAGVEALKSFLINNGLFPDGQSEAGFWFEEKTCGECYATPKAEAMLFESDEKSNYVPPVGYRKPPKGEICPVGCRRGFKFVFECESELIEICLLCMRERTKTLYRCPQCYEGVLQDGEEMCDCCRLKAEMVFAESKARGARTTKPHRSGKKLHHSEAKSYYSGHDESRVGETPWIIRMLDGIIEALETCSEYIVNAIDWVVERTVGRMPGIKAEQYAEGVQYMKDLLGVFAALKCIREECKQTQDWEAGREKGTRKLLSTFNDLTKIAGLFLSYTAIRNLKMVIRVLGMNKAARFVAGRCIRPGK